MGRLSNVSAALDTYTIEKFGERQVRFYHSDNIEQVRQHFQNGRLLTRRDLLSNSENPTGFYSDLRDARLGFDDRIFGNPYDLGEIFVRGSSDCAPYIYGPIVFEFRPDVYSLMSDIIITPKSIVGYRDGWQGHHVQDEATTDTMVAHNSWGDTIVRGWQGCEISSAKCDIPLTYLSSIIVEPIAVERWPLHQIVSFLRDRHAPGVEVRERPYRRNNPGALALIQGLRDFCHALPEDIAEGQWDTRVPPLPENLGSLSESQITRCRLWCRYFYFGSLQFARSLARR